MTEAEATAAAAAEEENMGLHSNHPTLFQCRICHEEEEEEKQRSTTMEAPCGCSGTLKVTQ